MQYYKELDRDTLQFLQRNLGETVKRNKERGKAYKALEREFFKMTACLINKKPDIHFAWMDRADLR